VKNAGEVPLHHHRDMQREEQFLLKINLASEVWMKDCCSIKTILSHRTKNIADVNLQISSPFSKFCFQFLLYYFRHCSVISLSIIPFFCLFA